MYNYLKIFMKSLAVGILALSCCAYANLSLKTDQNKQTMSYTFIQSADKSILTPLNKDKGLYQLKLLNLQAYTHYISDRPDRVTGMMPTDKFFQAWTKQNSNSFATDAPNVSLSGMELHGVYKNKTLMLMLVLSNPKYDIKKNEITYDAKILGKNPEILASASPIKLNNIVLFIDSGWCPGCCCG